MYSFLFTDFLKGWNNKCKYVTDQKFLDFCCLYPKKDGKNKKAMMIKNRCTPKCTTAIISTEKIVVAGFTVLFTIST